jgi:hypothetical protein
VGILFNNPLPSGVLGSMGFSLCSDGKIKRSEFFSALSVSLRILNNCCFFPHPLLFPRFVSALQAF